jgi:phospholipid N-methyltransferase
LAGKQSYINKEMFKTTMSIAFLKQSLSEPKSIGAITESSEELTQCIVSMASLHSAKTVIELGSGTGVFTEEIVNNIRPDTLFFALETNPHFVEKTKERCPDALIYHASATEICRYLELHGKKNADTIISSLPFASFDEELQIKILQEIRDSLSNNGEFLTFAYIHSILLDEGKKFAKQLHAHFSQIRKSEIIWKNMPPAFVYYCKK